MRKSFVVAGFIALIGVCTVSAAFAGAFESGAASWKHGDYRAAMRDWQALSATDSTIQNNFGIMYKDGKGVPQNYTTAATWFSRSAAQGNSLGQNNLGGLYRDGAGVQRDFGRAITFFRAAAQQGNAAAQVNLGLMLLNGQGVASPDPANAYMWFDLAVRQGVTQAVAARQAARQRLSANDVAMAAQASQRCRANNFKNCAV